MKPSAAIDRPSVAEHVEFLELALEQGAVRLADPDAGGLLSTVATAQVLRSLSIRPPREDSRHVETVLIGGPRGSGKSRLAQFLSLDRWWTCRPRQERSRVFAELKRAPERDAITLLRELRAGQPEAKWQWGFRRAPAVNVEPQLFDSALFGVYEGAFTGAVPGPGVLRWTRQPSFQDRKQRAWSGDARCRADVFLDEVGDLPPSAQPKLLSALSSGEFEPVGARGESQPVIDRFVFATTALHLRVNDREFRPDLFDRIASPRLELPALGDVPKPVFERAARITVQEVARAFGIEVPSVRWEGDLEVLDQRRQHWTGNYRELRKILERFLQYYAADYTSFDPRDVAEAVERSFNLSAPGEEPPVSYQETLKAHLEAECREYLLGALGAAPNYLTGGVTPSQIWKRFLTERGLEDVAEDAFLRVAEDLKIEGLGPRWTPGRVKDTQNRRRKRRSEP